MMVTAAREYPLSASSIIFRGVWLPASGCSSRTALSISIKSKAFTLKKGKKIKIPLEKNDTEPVLETGKN